MGRVKDVQPEPVKSNEMQHPQPPEEQTACPQTKASMFSGLTNVHESGTRARLRDMSRLTTLRHRRMAAGCSHSLSVAVLALYTVLAFSSGANANETSYNASAFTNCPSKAFLTQGSIPQTFGVNLVTGSYQVKSSGHGTTSPLNGVGFNFNDRYIYAWSYEHNQPARIHNDWQIEVLAGVNTTDTNFYVGDVDTVSNKYYVYRKGASYGLFSIGLDSEVADYLQMNQVIAGDTLSLSIYDMAFHPTDGYAYAVEADGDLHRIDVGDGSSSKLGNTAVTGTFGAAYFDPDGNLYISRNNDGEIFRIAVDSGIYTAEAFAKGPPSSTNDGSRCAAAPLIDDSDTDIDFGDAPDSYGTTIANNGARHGLTTNPGLYLGQTVDGESDSSFFPLSDDATGNVIDEDGVQFVTNIVAGNNAVALIEASDTGYVSVWIDVGRDGQFDLTDQVLQDHAVNAGSNTVYLNIPTTVSEGSTWARVRLSSDTGLLPIGGVGDGEVEDYAVSVLEDTVSVVTYPSQSGWTTVAFEDNWPYEGDYDFNDLVTYLRTETHTKYAGVSKVVISGELAAVGAHYHNGFAIRLPGVLRSNINEAELEFKINGQIVETSPLEQGRTEAIIVIAGDTFDFVSTGESCDYYRTETGCGSAIEMSFSVSVPFIEAVDVDLQGVYDPFLFASEGKWHGAHFSSPPGRSYEVHLKNQEPTEAFNQALFANIGDDGTSPSEGLYFLTDNGMPWAVEISGRWDYPAEYIEISKAYPKFPDYATSDGQLEPLWHQRSKAIIEKLFED